MANRRNTPPSPEQNELAVQLAGAALWQPGHIEQVIPLSIQQHHFLEKFKTLPPAEQQATISYLRTPEAVTTSTTKQSVNNLETLLYRLHAEGHPTEAGNLPPTVSPTHPVTTSPSPEGEDDDDDDEKDSPWQWWWTAGLIIGPLASLLLNND